MDQCSFGILLTDHCSFVVLLTDHCSFVVLLTDDCSFGVLFIDLCSLCLQAKGSPAETSLPYPNEALLDVTIKQSEQIDATDPALLDTESQMEAPMPKKVWIDFDQFCVCFR